MGKRLALVGVGKWGANFLRTIVGSSLDELTIIVSSKSREQLDFIAVSNARILPDISLIYDYATEIDGAIVATPPEVRPDIVDRLLRCGVPVLAEKPLSLSADTSIKLVRSAKSSGTPLVEDFIHLFSWPYLLIKEQLTDSWPISIVSRGEGWGPFRDYSPLLDYSPHDLAMVLQIFDCLPSNIQLEMKNYNNSLAFTAIIKLDFAERGQANISISNISREKVRQFRLTQNNECWMYDDGNSNKLTCNNVPQSSVYADDSPMQLLLDHFCGRKKLYQQDKLLWLSQSVAHVLKCLETQYDSIIKIYH